MTARTDEQLAPEASDLNQHRSRVFWAIVAASILALLLLCAILVLVAATRA